MGNDLASKSQNPPNGNLVDRFDLNYTVPNFKDHPRQLVVPLT